MIRVILPAHLRNIARVDGEVELNVAGPITIRSVLQQLESDYPVLRGTILEYVTEKRRPWIRFFACGQDISHDTLDNPLPDAVINGDEPLMVVGAIAGG